MDEWGPEKIVCVSDARTGMKGVLVIDNTARGMGKGGTRMSPTVTVAEVARLARVMTWKWAGTDLFYGGAKAGIVADSTAPNREEIIRAWARALSNEIPREYVLGLDMGLSEADAGIVQDEIGDRGAAVGSPTELGGVPYDKLGVTGFGVGEAADVAASATGMSISGSRVAIQGFGAVGFAAAKRLDELGAKVVAISTVHGALHDPKGLDVPSQVALRENVGDLAVKEYGKGEILATGSELRVDTDILVPAAIQDVIDKQGAKEVTARLVVEGANLPTSEAAQQVLRERKVTVVPDFIANAGGIIAAGFAMDARYSAFRPDPQRVFDDISTRVRANTTTVLEEARRRESTTHAAARTLAQERVRRAMELKGRLGQQ
jgi:glutamate dehydrogenase (NAD(P)+)